MQDLNATKIKSEISIITIFATKPDEKLTKNLINLNKLQKEDEHSSKIYDSVNSGIYACSEEWHSA